MWLSLKIQSILMSSLLIQRNLLLLINRFGEEQKFCKHDDSKDESGNLEIPSPLDFFFVLKKGTIKI